MELIQCILSKMQKTAHVLTDREVILRFLDSETVSPSSKATYARGLNQFFLFVRTYAKGPSWDAGDIEAYKATLIAAGYSPSTITGYLVIVRKFFAWSETAGFYPNIAKYVSGVARVRGHRHPYLTTDDVLAIIKTADKKTPEGRRNHCILSLMVRAGLRSIELARADVGDVFVWGRSRVLNMGKMDGKTVMFLTPDMWAPIQKHLKERRVLSKPGTPLFASLSSRNLGDRLTPRTFSGIAKKAIEAAGLSGRGLSATALRKQSMYLAFSGGASLEEVKAMARHKDIRTTRLYAGGAKAVSKALKGRA
jgi:site-specific recombinase XerD